MIEKSSGPLRTPSGIAFVAMVILFLAGCDRAVEPFDPEETPRPPDLSRIFPEAESSPSPGDRPAGGVMGGASARGNLLAAPPASESGETIRGTIELDPSLAGAPPEGAVLFVIARRQGGGPPLAVIRETDARFPYAFEIGQANVMIPSLRFEGEILLTARLDSDGNATTRLPGDLSGSADGTHSPGATQVRLVIDQKL